MLGRRIAVAQSAAPVGRASGAGARFDTTWVQARAVVRSGRLGPLLWATGCYCDDGRTADGWAPRLDPLMFAMTLDEHPARVSCLGNEAPTVIAEFLSGPVIVLAAASRPGPDVRSVIRGAHASLIVDATGLLVRPHSGDDDA